MNSRRFTLNWLLLLVVLLVTGLFQVVLAQATNGVLTNSPPTGTGIPNFPMGKEAIWLALVPPITFTITWALGKIPPLPKEFLPWITPVSGILIGAAINWATKANLPWWSTAGAGAISTTMYEGLKGLTKAGPESALTPTPKPPSS